MFHRHDRTLRVALLFPYIPAFVLCIVAGSLNDDPIIGIALIPMTASFVSSCYLLLKRNKQPHSNSNEEIGSHGFGAIRLGGAQGGKYPSLFHVLLLDFTVAVLLMVDLVLTWAITMGFSKYEFPDAAIVTCYATFPLLASFSIHSYLVLLNLGSLIKLGTDRLYTPRECANCHARYHPRDGHVSAIRGPEDYILTRESEDIVQTTPGFRDASFDGDAAMRPDAAADAAETGSKAS